MPETALAPSPRPPFAAVPTRARRRVLRRLALAVLTVPVVLALALAGAWLATPGVDDARARVDALLAATGGTPLTGELPERLVVAVLATEDSRFADHPGIDWRGALRAPLGVVLGRDLGGSTLEQQLAKNLYGDGDTGPAAKAQAVVLALKLSAGWTKEEVLRMYLDTAYYGHGYTGVVAASEGYFGVPPGELSWAQASLLAGLLQAPSAYDPVVHPELAAARQAHVLDRLVDVGALSRAEADDVGDQAWELVAG
ncbi:biosynthetic peptidoglycan transglycosylase [Blastococcus sp. SYSU D00820]